MSAPATVSVPVPVSMLDTLIAALQEAKERAK